MQVRAKCSVRACVGEKARCEKVSPHVQDAQNIVLRDGTMRSMPYRVLPSAWTCRLGDLSPHPAESPAQSTQVWVQKFIPCVFVHSKACGRLKGCETNLAAGVCPFAAAGAAPVATARTSAAPKRLWIKLDDAGHGPVANLVSSVSEEPLTTEKSRAGEGSSAEQEFRQWIRGLPGDFPVAKVIWLHIPKVNGAAGTPRSRTYSIRASRSHARACALRC